MDKLAEGEGDDITTFEETLQRFVGLSSEEIWELQRILVRRVRCKLSETLSPEGKTAMKQVKQEMHERHVQGMNAPVSLVTELIDMGSKQSEGNGQPERKLSKNIVLTVTKEEECLKKSVDVIDTVAEDNKTQPENTSLPNGDAVQDETEMVTNGIDAMADDIDKKAVDIGKVENGHGLVTNGEQNAMEVTNDNEDTQIHEENVQERVGSSKSSRNTRGNSRESSRSVRISSRESSRIIDPSENIQEGSKDTEQNTELKEEATVKGQIVSETTNEELSVQGRSEDMSEQKSSETENTPS